MYSRQIECSDDSIRLSTVTLKVNIFPVQPWGLQVSLIDWLCPADVAHRDLILLVKGDVLGEGITLNNKLLPISDVLVFFENVADGMSVITRLVLELSIDRRVFHHYFEYF